MTLIDGKAISEQIKQEIAAEVADIVAHGGKTSASGCHFSGSRWWK